MMDLHKNCTGCTACAMACPKQAIAMVADEEGFLYPQIDEARCVHCGLCRQICPQSSPPAVRERLGCFAVQHKDAAVLEQSSSGGMFTALSDQVLEEGGAVYGAAFDEDFRVVHIRAQNQAQRDKCRGSKYVQSDLGDVFRLVKTDLEQDRTVLFTGTPCQVDGLRAYLGKDHPKLLLCDLVCHGVTSPKIWSDHVRLLEKRNRAKLTSYQFRPKDWGWEVHNEKAAFANGKVYHSTAYSTAYTQLYYSRLIHRPFCHNCPYSQEKRVSDITIADCRGIEKTESNIHAHTGVSLVMVHSEKGMALFEKVRKNLTVEALEVQSVLQPPLRGPSPQNPKRELFWDAYRKAGYWQAFRAIYGKLYVLKYYVKKIIGR